MRVETVRTSEKGENWVLEGRARKRRRNYESRRLDHKGKEEENTCKGNLWIQGGRRGGNKWGRMLKTPKVKLLWETEAGEETY